jgi:predicted amidohydrolase
MSAQLLVSLIQTDLHWENKAANLAMLEEKLPAIGKTEVVVLPEMFSTGFSMQPSQLAETMEGPTVGWMKRMAAQHKIILTGSIIIEENGHYFNRLIWMQPNGQYGYYDKRHLFAFAGEDAVYTAGTKRLIASVKGFKINVQICYDLRFPVWARQQPMPDAPAEYDVLLYVANWPERRVQAWQTLLQARAIENQCYVIGVNRIGNDGNGIYHNGCSRVVDAIGQVLFEQADEACIHTLALSMDELTETRTKLPFLKDRDSFSIHH